MKESYSEGVTTHTDPESCGGDCEVAVEALDRGTYGSHEVIAYSEGSDAFTSVIVMDGGGRGLFIVGSCVALAAALERMGVALALITPQPAERQR
jgi:hypothetical protein